MKMFLITIMLMGSALIVGFYVGTRSGQLPGDKFIGKEEAPAPIYWVAPMDPAYRRDSPGKSPMGMDLLPVYADSGNADDDVVRINPAVENNLGVRTEVATVRPLWRRVEATGYVGLDETRISHINIRTEGWISKLVVKSEGERVAKGDLLFELYSPELINAQKEYFQADRRGDSRLKNSAAEKLRALGMIADESAELAVTGEVSENIRVVAPQDGVVSSLSVREGMFVAPNTAIMSLADLSSVWLQAEVFESQAEWVAAGQAAEARLNYLPGEVFTGQVDYVYPILDAVTRTLRVRLRFENPLEALKPNMYSRVSIFGKLQPDALSISREALIRAQGKDRVVVSLGEGRFRVHEVITGMESGEWVEILAGIGAGDRIVTSAQFLLDSEASLSGSIRRLDSVPELPDQSIDRPVHANGRVDAIDLARNRIRISHGPIDEIGWPSMTMEFSVMAGVDLSKAKEGEDILFILKQQHAGEYVIEQLGFTGVDAAGTRKDD